MMDRMDAFLRGLTLNEELGLRLDPKRIDQLVTERLNPHRGSRRPTVTYNDPTGNAAAAAADRRKR